MYETIRQFFDACHPFGLPLLACSVIMLAAILYHLLFTRRHKCLSRLEEVAAGTTPSAAVQELCAAADGVVPALCRSSAPGTNWSAC
ncbi:MAG: hypothetical protein IJ971_04315, partial [Bacteroidales bacterium]|nr:hypothetical protein [Bacteroidales bacterium]